MTIEINDDKTVLDVQTAFSKRYPFLKIEFFSKAANLEDIPCLPERFLGEIRHKHDKGLMTINPGNETGSVEQEFKKKFDLDVQIYRLQLDHWIETSGSDILTLKELNEISKDSAIFYNSDHQLTGEP